MLRRLLIVDGNPAEGLKLAEAFPNDEFLVRNERTGLDALDCAFAWKPDCVVLDTGLAGVTWIDVCSRIKSDSRGGRVPVLLTSANREQALVNRGFREGADDFMVKPCNANELLWRVRGLLRRYEAPAPPEQILRVGPITLDCEQGLASVDHRDLSLTKKELQVLEVFLRNPSRLLKRQFLLENIWGHDSSAGARVVDLCVFQLRKKLGSQIGRCLQTRRGFGYFLAVDRAK